MRNSPWRRSDCLILFALSILCARQVFAQGSAAEESQIQQGKAVYQHWCTPCHGVGRGNPGTAALAAKYKGREPAIPAVLEERADVTPAVTRGFVRRGVSVMAPFRKTEISDAELNAVAAYLARRR